MVRLEEVSTAEVPMVFDLDHRVRDRSPSRPEMALEKCHREHGPRYVALVAQLRRSDDVPATPAPMLSETGPSWLALTAATPTYRCGLRDQRLVALPNCPRGPDAPPASVSSREAAAA